MESTRVQLELHSQELNCNHIGIANTGTLHGTYSPTTLIASKFQGNRRVSVYTLYVYAVKSSIFRHVNCSRSNHFGYEIENVERWLLRLHPVAFEIQEWLLVDWNSCLRVQDNHSDYSYCNSSTPDRVRTNMTGTDPSVSLKFGIKWVQYLDKVNWWVETM